MERIEDNIRYIDILYSVPPSHQYTDRVFDSQQYISEVQQLLKCDTGNLWGISLEGPVLLVDPDSRAVVANRTDDEGDRVYVMREIR